MKIQPHLTIFTPITLFFILFKFMPNYLSWLRFSLHFGSFRTYWIRIRIRNAVTDPGGHRMRIRIRNTAGEPYGQYLSKWLAKYFDLKNGPSSCWFKVLSWELASSLFCIILQHYTYLHYGINNCVISVHKQPSYDSSGNTGPVTAQETRSQLIR
jgi:hypothetical protein